MEFQSVVMSRVLLGKYSQVGANSVLLPSARLGQGAVLGALSLLKEETDEWTIYAGIPKKSDLGIELPRFQNNF
jgi:galactoside O-acetyltransferase